MPNSNDNHKLLAKALDRVNHQVKQYLQSQDPFLQQWLSGAAIAHGKRLRVRLTLLAAQVCGRVKPTVERLATALELFHYATLIHDDVIDNAEKRRHYPTLNARHGNEIAVLLGDLLFTRVMTILFENVPARIQKMVLKTAVQVCLGEAQEHHVRGKLTLSQAKYCDIIANKTASLFAICCQGGAELAGGSKTQVTRLMQYGNAFGMAFQIQDDILDLLGDPAQVGKSLGTDLKEGRITLPVILGLKRLRGAERQRFCKAVLAGNKQLAYIRRILKTRGILDEAQAIAAGFARQAIDCLQGLADSNAKRELVHLAEFALDRDC